MEFSAAEISALLHGEILGDKEVKVHNIAPIDKAYPGALSFLHNPKYYKFLETTKASVVLVPTSLNVEKTNATCIKLDNVYQSLSVLLGKVQELQQPSKKGIEELSFVAESASLGQNIYIGAFTYIGENVQIGDNVQLFPGCYIGDNSVVGENSLLHAGVKVYANTKIGQNVVIHSGVVLGSDGFGFAPNAKGVFEKIPQIGQVVIHDDVEIGANTVIDRATFDATEVRKGVKLDNLIQIAHNVEIGENTAVAAQAGISGSTKIGRNCLIGGQAGIVGHISIADQSQIGAKAGIGKSITTPGKAWSGRPATEHHHHLKEKAASKQLPTLVQKVQTLERELQELKKAIKGQA